MTGTLTLCGTPIGNLGDAPPRLAEALAAADVIYAEDTRRARVLLDHLDVTTRARSYFAGNEATRSDELTEALRSGEAVALITDAGMPTVSDPGLSAVQVAHEVGATVTVVPGPSAALAALAVSGLAADRFVFEGFLPRKGRERTERLADLATEPRTIVVFSATSRVPSDLDALADALGADRPVTVARELTKVHEEIWSGSLAEAAAEWRDRSPKGEFTLVVAGRPEAPPAVTDAVAEVTQRIERGQPMSDAVRAVAEATGLRRRSLYEAVIAARSTD